MSSGIGSLNGSEKVDSEQVTEVEVPAMQIHQHVSLSNETVVRGVRQASDSLPRLKIKVRPPPYTKESARISTLWKNLSSEGRVVPATNGR